MLINVLVSLSRDSDIERLTRLLNREEVLIRGVSSKPGLLEHLSSTDFDLLIVERSFLPDHPEGWIQSVRSLPERPEIVVMTREDDADERASLIARGCLGVFHRYLGDRALRETLTAYVQRRREEAINRLRAERPEEQYSLNDFVSESPVMQVFLELARKVVRADTTLLLLGETGVGKERMARAIHAEGPRSSGPFLAINCGAIPESLLESELFGHEEGAFTGATRARKGHFEMAHRGTIFLDEVGDIPLHLQVKLLRVLDERRFQRVGGEKAIDVDVRVMAATNRDLEAEVAANRFRSDLFFRLAVVTLMIPPLRERRDDIRHLVQSYLEHFRNQMGKPASRISEAAIEALVRYDWPGNVRELVNTVERAVLIASGDAIEIADLPDRVAGRAARTREAPGSLSWGFETLPPDLLAKPLLAAKRQIVAAFEKRYLTELLHSARGRIGEAARRASIHERSLYELMRKHELKKEDFR